MADTLSPQDQDVVDELRSKGVDVIRVSYSDLMGVDRGRDILIEQVGSAIGHGMAFCRAVFHTTPMGDVVPIQGGLESGLPDIKVRPDLSHVALVPWEPGVAWCIGDVFDEDGTPAPDAPRNVAKRVAEQLAELGLSAVVGPELEFFLCEVADGHPSGHRRYGDAPGNVYVVGFKGDPQNVLLRGLRALRDTGILVTAANHEFSGGQFEINLDHSEMLDSADRAFRMKSGVQEIARHHGMLGDIHGQAVQRRGRQRASTCTCRSSRRAPGTNVFSALTATAASTGCRSSGLPRDRRRPRPRAGAWPLC